MIKHMMSENNVTITENGAVTLLTTESDCLDLFATIGALRDAEEQEILDRFIRAYTENSNAAMKLLFFTRDIRGGLGERRIFKIIFAWLAKNEPTSVRKNIEYVAEYGRFDDLLVLIGTPCEKHMLEILRSQFEQDMENMESTQAVSLLGKWLPSVNASCPDTIRKAKLIAKSFGLSEKEYRKSVSALRARIHIIENNLREKDYSFEYEKQPSRAMFKYRKAFSRNDAERYQQFINRVSAGETVLHADNVSPYELIEPYLSGCWWSERTSLEDISKDEKNVLNATWQSLPDYAGDENSIAVVDTSGSMYCGAKPLPAAVALSLGLYFAERNKGVFAQHFIEFSEKPKLIKIKGKTFVDRLRYITTFNEIADTNLEAVFDLVLSTALKHQVPQEELPAKVIIISDMEFNACVNHASMSNFDSAKKKYEDAGYKLPQIIFWNAASRNRQQPVKMNEQGVALVSGVTPKLFEMIAGGNLSPYTFMMEVLQSERYAKIVA